MTTDEALARITRGPCGGWHFRGYPKAPGRRHRPVTCAACIRLARRKEHA